MQCSRCGEPSQTKTRGENFCSRCYFTFINKKFRSAMSFSRVNGSLVSSGTSKPKLPVLYVYISFGVSSLALIDLLINMLETQKKKNNGMTGFEIKCIHLYQPDDSTENNTVEKAYSDHGTLENDNWPWKDFSVQKIALPNLEVSDNMSRSSRHDFEAVFIRQFALRMAVKNKGTAVFGYSMTKLSELTLSETVKGRGHLIPTLISPDLHNDHTVYPLREITLPELKEYCKLRQLEKYIIPDPVVPGITKMQSIDEIIRQYFADVQKGFPSVVSTVAKVASRLSQEPETCRFCHLGDEETAELCYACRTTMGKASMDMKLQVLEQFEL